MPRMVEIDDQMDPRSPKAITANELAYRRLQVELIAATAVTNAGENQNTNHLPVIQAESSKKRV